MTNDIPAGPVNAFGGSRWFATLLLPGVVCGWLLTGAWTASAQNGYVWQNVTISGAQAFVTAVIADHSGLVCIRTDCGGAYRWDRPSSTWVQFMDFLPFTNRDGFGGEALAIDPNNSNVLYYAGGLYSSDPQLGVIYKTTNGGSAWSPTGLSLEMNSQGDRRWAGERLAVDPTNSSVVLFGSRYNGLYRTTNGGTSWAQVSSIPTAADEYGVQSVAFDPAANGIVYVAVSGNGVYQSTNDGATFKAIGGSTSPRRLAVALNGTNNGTLWYTSTNGVSQYAGGAWTTYAPGNNGPVYCGLAINPSNSLDIIVGNGEPWQDIPIYRTLNGGTNWFQLTSSYTTPVTWFNNWNALSSIAFAFDPLNTNMVWKCQCSTTNINKFNGTNASVHWVDNEPGHEQDVMGSLVTPPSGAYELLTGSWDDDGFAFTNLNVYPANQLGIVGSYNGNTWGMAYERTNPANLLRIGGQSYYGGAKLEVSSSINGGATWYRLKNFPTTNFPVVCAVSATNPQDMVVIGSHWYSSDPTGGSWPSNLTNTAPWLCSTNWGTNWLTITGLPTPPSYVGQTAYAMDLAADGANGNTFYYYSYGSDNGAIYASTNGGQSFQLVADGPPSNVFVNWWQFKARPDVAGDLWLSLDLDSPTWQVTTRNPAVEGLYHSTNGGVNWTKLATVGRCWSFGFGLPGVPGGPATLFMYGRTPTNSTSDSIYRSLDLGQTWINIQSPTNLLGDYPDIIEGSWQTVGRVFVGTGGRGTFYGTYVPPGTYVLTVNNGNGSGTCTNGVPVAITAPATLPGQMFANWATNVGNPIINSPHSNSTSLLMPANSTQTNVVVTAAYEGLAMTGVGVSNSFGFTITGGQNSRTNQVTVYSSTNLANWQFLENVTLTNSSMYFSLPQWTNQPVSFYRLQFILLP